MIDTNVQLTHVMALALDSRTDYHTGVLRCITSRIGDVGVKGYVDRSELHLVAGNSLESFQIGQKLDIKNEAEIIHQLSQNSLEFIGLEDPDIWIDTNSNLLHLYFTLPFINVATDKYCVHLGHAVGRDLNSLEMTLPSLMADDKISAKELSIAPLNRQGFRFNLVESSDKINNVSYSVVRVAVVEDMAKPWTYGNIVFHPGKSKIPWIGGHASPGPLFSKNFIDVGSGKCLGLINGREANQQINGHTVYGIFSVGLFIYDFETGVIDWVSPQPFIYDSEAKNITFASQFVATKPGEGILFAHVDDSFVRAYTLNAASIKSLLP